MAEETTSELLKANEEHYTFKAGEREFRVMHFEHEEAVCTTYKLRVTVASDEIIDTEDMLLQESLLTIYGRDGEPYVHGVILSAVNSLPKGPHRIYRFKVVPLVRLLKDHTYNGAVFEPFYQFGGLTLMGTKPLVGKTRMDVLGAKKYQWCGFLRNMRYGYVCVAGNRAVTRTTLAFAGTKAARDEYRVSLDTEARFGETALVVEDFLTSNAQAVEHTELFLGRKTVVPLMRLDGSGGQVRYVAPLYAFIKDIQGSRAKTARLRWPGRNSGELVVDGFDWRTPVEFILVAACDDLKNQDYGKSALSEQYKQIKLDWQKVPCSITLEEVTGLLDLSLDMEGPTYESSLHYLGTVTRTTAGLKISFRFEPAGTPEAALEPVLDILKQNDFKAGDLAGFGQAMVASDKRHLFAAHFTMNYKSPKGVTITSIRPFGHKKIKPDGSPTGAYYTFGFKQFTSGGTSGFDKVKPAYIADHSFDYRYKFSSPVNFLANAPWTRPSPILSAKTENDFEEKLLRRLKVPALEYAEAVEWLEKQSQFQEWLTIEAVKSA